MMFLGSDRRATRLAWLALVLLCASCRSPSAATPPTTRATRASTALPTATRRLTITPTVSSIVAIPLQVRLLAEQLFDAEAVRRAEAAHALGLLGPEAESATSALIALLEDDTPLFAQFGLASTSPAQEAAIALARIGQSEGIERLVQDLRSGDNSERTRSVVALSALRDVGIEALRATAPLEALLEVAIDPRFESRVRSQAIRLLGRLREPSAIDRLGRLLSDPSAPVRTASASALGEIADCRAVPWILDAMARADSAERFLLDAVLTQITTQTFGGDLRAWQDWWAAQVCPEVE